MSNKKYILKQFSSFNCIFTFKKKMYSQFEKNITFFEQF